MANAVSASRLLEPQPAAEHGILGRLSVSVGIGTKLVAEPRLFQQLARVIDAASR